MINHKTLHTGKKHRNLSVLSYLFLGNKPVSRAHRQWAVVGERSQILLGPSGEVFLSRGFQQVLGGPERLSLFQSYWLLGEKKLQTQLLSSSRKVNISDYKLRNKKSTIIVKKVSSMCKHYSCLWQANFTSIKGTVSWHTWRILRLVFHLRLREN